MYLRPSGKMADPTQPKTMTYSLSSFYKDNFEPSKMTTQKKYNSKPYCMCHCRTSQAKHNIVTNSNLTTHDACLFFAMRSCKYVKVTKQEQRQTDILKLKNLRFLKKPLADCISVLLKCRKKIKDTAPRATWLYTAPHSASSKQEQHCPPN